MANRYMTQFQLTMEKKVVELFAKITFGASGAPTLDAVNSKGIKSVTRNSAGVYTFVFGTTVNGKNSLDRYVKLLAARHIFKMADATTGPASPGLWISDISVAAATCSLQVVMHSGGTPTDPASGEVCYFTFVMGDSTAP